jgi:cellulose synthase/poly-beta-1,6-N-acetylglucosamine synthase-like glycosyltransferase
MSPDHTAKKHSRRRRLALLLPGHNEEMIIAATIRSAIAAGMHKKNIYVVDDNSDDRTREIAIKELGVSHVLSVPRSGKARAVKQAFEYFNFEQKYAWMHVADADSIFCPNYFRIYCRYLNVKECSAAVGFVQSMGGNWIANYRSFSYTYGQHIFRRIQSWFGVIAVLPGPVTCFQTDIIKDLEFESESLTEDFDLTLQIHRKKLGRIKFVPEAVNFTQDPRTLKDFYDQTLRWQRGFFQGVRKYRIGMRPHFIDVGVGYQLGETIYYLFQLLILLPYLALATHGFKAPLMIITADFIAICGLAVFSAVVTKRPVILTTLPYFYILRLFELLIFVQAFIEIIILRRFQTVQVGWDTEGRRYEVAADEIESMMQ